MTQWTAETTTILMVTACVLKRPGVVVPVSVVEEEAVLLTSPAGKAVRLRKEPTTELELQVCKKANHLYIVLIIILLVLTDIPYLMHNTSFNFVNFFYIVCFDYLYTQNFFFLLSSYTWLSYLHFTIVPFYHTFT